MSEMVERAARAMYEAFKLPEEVYGKTGEIEWDEMDESQRESWLTEARAAIASLQVPTPEVLAAIARWQHLDPATIWSMALRAALLDAPTVAERG